MSSPERLPEVRALSRLDKLQLMRVLAEDLARSEDGPLHKAGREYALRSPDRAYDAAAGPLRGLETDRTVPCRPL